MKKQKVNFFQLLNEQCDYMCKATEMLYDYTKEHDVDLANEIIALETEADMVRRVLIDALNTTFFTPLDREDLFDLSRNIDEIIDYAKSTVQEIMMFNVKPDKQLSKMVFIIMEMAQRIQIAISNLEKRPNISKEEAIKVKKLENKVGELCTKSIAKLFELDDFKTILKYREIYRHINTTADVADTAMDFLLDIIVKLQ